VTIRGDYLALVVALVVLRLAPFRFDEIMNGRGKPYFDPQTYLLVGAGVLAMFGFIVGASFIGAEWTAALEGVKAR